MNNLLSYRVLIDAKIRDSDKVYIYFVRIILGGFAQSYLPVNSFFVPGKWPYFNYVSSFLTIFDQLSYPVLLACLLK